MNHVNSRSLIDHRERARVLSAWELALWWMGTVCIVIAFGLILFGFIEQGLLAALVYWPIAATRNACSRAVERNVALVREDIREGGTP